MELLGEKFKSIRISKGISLDRAEEDTRISKQYLEALENNEFDKFPGETYILGFIRNYSDFLGLNQEEMLSKYKNMKIQEMPTPVEELLSNKKPFPVFKVGIALMAVVIIVIIGLAGTVIIENSIPSKNEIQKRTINPNSSIIEFNGQFLEQNLVEGNKISFLLDNNDMYIVTVTKIYSDSVMFSSEFGAGKIEKEVPIKLGSSDVIDFNENNDPDIKVVVKTVAADKTTAQIRFDKAINTTQTVTVTQTPEQIENAEELIKPVIDDIITTEKENAIDDNSLIVVAAANRAEPFYLSITFRERCYIQYSVDSDPKYYESYFFQGKLLRIDATKKINIALSNAGAAYASLNGKEINLGNFGTVASKQIGWRYNSANKKNELYIRNLK